ERKPFFYKKQNYFCDYPAAHRFKPHGTARNPMITVLGSTGSIGVNTLDVVRQHGERFPIFALVAGRNLDVLCSQIQEFRPKVVVVADNVTLDTLRTRLRDMGLSPARWPE